MLPAVAIIAKFLKQRDPLWFHLHRAFQVVGLAIAFTGWLVALLNFTPHFDEAASTNKARLIA